MMQLEKVIGNTIKSSCALSVNAVTGEFAYPAGCVLVFYNPRKNRQTHYFSSSNNKALQCSAFSADGCYVAAGESGRQPSVHVWDTSSGTHLAELQGHSFTVKAIQLSRDGRLLASAGSRGDGRLKVWEWRSGTLIANARFKIEIHSLDFSSSDNVLVSAGAEGHLKYWDIRPTTTSNSKAQGMKGRKAIMEGGPPTAGDFVEIASNLTRNNELIVYAVTSDGFLLSFDADRAVDKWVDLKSRKVSSLAVNDSHVACACCDGLVRLFHPETLEYIATLPRPPPFRPKDTAESARSNPVEAVWPDTLSVRLTRDGQRLGCAYSDRSLFIWDLRDAKKVCRCRAMYSHAGSIWDLEFLNKDSAERLGFAPDTFVTCSSDSTLRLWCLPQAHATKEHGSKGHSLRDLLAVAECDDNANTSSTNGKSRTGGGLRCVRISTDGRYVASGDKAGNLRVHKISPDMEMKVFLEAHDAEVLSLDFGGINGALLASGGRDKLIHLFDADSDYDLIDTFEDHTSAVTCVRFAGKGSRLVSCGGDKKLAFKSITQTSTGAKGRTKIDVKHVEHLVDNTIYDVCVDRTGKLAVTAGQDNSLTLWDTFSGSRKRRYEMEVECTLRVRFDPSGRYTATTSSDKGIRLYDLQSGKMLCKAFGHSEPVTVVAFSPSSQHLVSCSCDGCIFVWKLPDFLINSISSQDLESKDPSLLQEKSGKSSSGQQANQSTAKKPGISDLMKIQEESKNDASIKKGESADLLQRQKAMLSSLLAEQDRPENRRSNTTTMDATTSNGQIFTSPENAQNAKITSVDTARRILMRGWNESPSEQLNENVSIHTSTDDDDLQVENLDDPTEGGTESDSKATQESDEEDDEDVVGTIDNDDDKNEFTVLTSAGVRLSQGYDMKHKDEVKTSIKEERDSDDDSEADNKTVTEDSVVDNQTFLKEALSEETVVIDPRSSLRVSRSTSHLLHKQIREALGKVDNREKAQETGEEQEDDFAFQTPRESTHDSSIPLATPESRDRSNIAREKNQALAREIENMRERLRAMGMCGGSWNTDQEVPNPTPAVSQISSAVPSLMSSPAKPTPNSKIASTSRMAQGNRKQEQHGTKGALDTNAMPPPTEGRSAVRPEPKAGEAMPPSQSATGTMAEQQLETNKEPTAEGSPGKLSLFAKMRYAGTVKAAERADTGISSSAKDVYTAVGAEETSLAQERQRLREEAKKKAEENVELLRQADEQARKEKFRGAKEEAEKIRLRLKELESRKKQSLGANISDVQLNATKESLETTTSSAGSVKEQILQESSSRRPGQTPTGTQREGPEMLESTSSSMGSTAGRTLSKEELQIAAARAAAKKLEVEEAKRKAMEADQALREAYEAANQERLQREQEMMMIKNQQVMLTKESDQEIGARRTAELAAVSALEQLKRLKDSSTSVATAPGAEARDGERLQPTGGIQARAPAEKDSSHRPDGKEATDAGQMLQVGVLSWASELGVEVVSPITLSEGPAGQSSFQHAGGDELCQQATGDETAGEEVLLVSTQHVQTESGPEVFERPSGAGELEDDSVDIEILEGKEEEVNSEGKGWLVRESCEHEALSTVIEPSGDEEIPEELDACESSSSNSAEQTGGAALEKNQPNLEGPLESQVTFEEGKDESEMKSTEAASGQGFTSLEFQSQAELPTKTYTYSPEVPLMPARLGDPNHPLRKLDIDASDFTLNSEMDETTSVRDQTCSAVDAGNRLRASVNATLDQYNIARASGSRQAMADVIAALRHSQHVINQVLDAYDSEVLQHSSRLCEETPAKVENQVTPLPVFNTDASRAARNVPALPLYPSHAFSVPSSGLPSARSSVDLGGSVSQRSQFGTNYSAISGSPRL
ncbi:hypothetical protein GUITHDRAFT_162765 [Guillardia theta CCMP2712]|uniref:Anaphase-promoting complex subunit 4 WD40 domain-containing protein n=4 Tax=Guillardia theta TaxID=55529 RepID=L1JG10_GUITC|nr:hypothetical protein GUITHDRAFT_162765 [Guillardia theta CCMP2712]EKX47079.1 hypothetical protein GUITHDRAFT_162765 [Guillardia theta CCMP2712]|eukprot:XP_005834059.1 hypothetical protein GUITHDRAFT_162765 [Guillardia theta CCMP2712]